MTTPENQGSGAENSPRPKIAAPAPIIAPGESESAIRDSSRSQVIPSEDLNRVVGSNDNDDPANMARVSDDAVQTDTSIWKQELGLGLPSPWKRPLPYLSGLLGLEAALSISVVVGTLVALTQDHGLAVALLPAVASLVVPITLDWGPLVAILGIGVVAALLTAIASWSASRFARPRSKEPGRFLRSTLGMAAVAQPFAFVTSLVTFHLDNPTNGNDLDPRMVALTEWSKITALFLWFTAAIVTLLAIRAVRLGRFRVTRFVAIGTALVTIAATSLATSSVFYTSPNVSAPVPVASPIGFWRLGAPIHTGLFDRIVGLSCPTQGSCAVVAEDQVAPLPVAWSIGLLAGGRIRTQTSLTSGPPRVISCATESICLITTSSGAAARSTDGGRTFRPLAAKIPLDTTFRCDSPSRCYAIGPYFFAMSTDAGGSWKTLLKPTINASSPSRTLILSGACTTLEDCFVLGYGVGRPYAAFTINGGRTWSSDITGATPSEWGDARCVGNNTCYGLAIGFSPDTSSIIVTKNAGRTWSAPAAIPGTGSPEGFSCPEIGTCIIVGQGLTNETIDSTVEVTTDGATTWHTTFSSAAELGPLGCDLQRRCAFGVTYVASGKGAAVEVSSNWGRTWRTVPFPRIRTGK